MNRDRLELLAQVARWYYIEDFPQAEIARRIGRSRSMVSRLLREARESGLVEITVHYPLVQTAIELENCLCETFGLSQASVLVDPPPDYPILIRRLGELGAHLLRHKFHDGVRVGIMWGTTIYEVIWALPAMPLAGSTVFQMIGTVGRGNQLMDGPELARSLAEKISGTYHYLPAPILAEDEAVAHSFLRQSAIADVLDQVPQVDVALLGIGTLEGYFSYLETTGYVQGSDLMALQQAGCAGSILGLFIGEDGRPLETAINRRVIGFKDTEALKSVPTVIAVAGGVHKARAVRAALCGGYLDVLITDAVTASKVLSLHVDRGGTVT